MLEDAAAIVDSLGGESIGEILDSWIGFVQCTETLVKGGGDLSVGSQIVPLVATLCNHGVASLAQDYFLQSIEVIFTLGASRFYCAALIFFFFFSRGSVDRKMSPF